jgi:hypothetical protein
LCSFFIIHRGSVRRDHDLSNPILHWETESCVTVPTWNCHYLAQTSPITRNSLLPMVDILLKQKSNDYDLELFSTVNFLYFGFDIPCSVTQNLSSATWQLSTYLRTDMLSPWFSCSYVLYKIPNSLKCSYGKILWPSNNQVNPLHEPIFINIDLNFVIHHQVI